MSGAPLGVAVRAHSNHGGVCLVAQVRDLWAHTDNGTATGALHNVTVRAHATVVVRLTKM